MIPFKTSKIKNLIKISGKLLMIDEITSFKIRKKIYTKKNYQKMSGFIRST